MRQKKPSTKKPGAGSRLSRLKEKAKGLWRRNAARKWLEKFARAEKIEGKLKTDLLALSSPKNLDRCHAASDLGRAGDKRVVPALLQALEGADSDLRSSIISALTRLRDTRAVPALIEALKDESVEIRHDAAQGLCILQDKRALKPLTEALKDPSPRVRWVAASLYDFKDKSVVPALIEAWKDPHDQVRMNPIRSLGFLGDERAVKPLLQTLFKDKRLSHITSRAFDDFALALVRDEASKAKLKLAKVKLSDLPGEKRGLLLLWLAFNPLELKKVPAEVKAPRQEWAYLKNLQHGLENHSLGEIIKILKLNKKRGKT